MSEIAAGPRAATLRFNVVNLEALRNGTVKVLIHRAMDEDFPTIDRERSIAVALLATLPNQAVTIPDAPIENALPDVLELLDVGCVLIRHN